MQTPTKVVTNVVSNTAFVTAAFSMFLPAGIGLALAVLAMVMSVFATRREEEKAFFVLTFSVIAVTTNAVFLTLDWFNNGLPGT